MTQTSTPATIRVDQFVAAPPAKVWRLLTEPELMGLWWAEGQVAKGLRPGRQTMADAFDRMGPGWCDVVFPRLAQVAAQA